MPDAAVVRGARGRVFYDADCSFCRGLLDRFAHVFAGRGFVFESLQQAILSGEFDLPAREFYREMKLLDADGTWHGGADAWIVLFRSVWYLKPVATLAALPGFHRIAGWIYRKIAANRHCLNGACKVGQASSLSPTGRESTTALNAFRTNRTAQAPATPQPTRWMPVLLWRALAVAPLLTLPAVAFGLRPQLEPWLFMWTLAFAIFAGCKWLTLITAIRRGTRYNWKTAFVYLTCWPGMNAATFPARDKTAAPPVAEWIAAFTKTFLGFVLTFAAIQLASATRLATGVSPFLVGWLGMIGIILMLHFGTFHLLSIILRNAGFNAPPMMKAPLLASSVGDFWGRRWNQPFHELTTQFLFNPRQRQFGPVGALMLAFLASGLVHDLIIALPAGGGYGLPTIYFLLQGAGLIADRRLFARHRRHRNHRRRLFAWLVIVGPVGLLFPPVFVERIILPMLHAIGAT